MLRAAAIVLVLVLSTSVAQASECVLCLDSVALQTRDGLPWSAGKPVTLVVRVSGSAALPETAQAVVMQTDGDRTKCLGVPLKLVQADASGGLYAGLFFPFRPARYDGKLSIGDDLYGITFDMNRMVAGTAPQGELPAAEPVDTSAAVPVLLSAEHAPWLALGLALLAVTLFTRRRALAHA